MDMLYHLYDLEIFDNLLFLSYKDEKLQKYFSSLKPTYLSFYLFACFLMLIGLSATIITFSFGIRSDDKVLESLNEMKFYVSDLQLKMLIVLDAVLFLTILVFTINRNKFLSLTVICLSLLIIFIKLKSTLLFSILSFARNKAAFYGYFSLLVDLILNYFFILVFWQFYSTFSIVYSLSSLASLIILKIYNQSKFADLENSLMFFINLLFVFTLYFKIYTKKENTFLRFYMREMRENFKELLETMGIGKVTLNKEGDIISSTSIIEDLAKNCIVEEEPIANDLNTSQTLFVKAPEEKMTSKVKALFMKDITVEGKVVGGKLMTNNVYNGMFSVTDMHEGILNYKIIDLFEHVNNFQNTFKKFTQIGFKLISNDGATTKFEVYARFNTFEGIIEVLYKDISLLQCIDELNRKNEMIPVQFGKILHEIKNPLLLISSLSEEVQHKLSQEGILDVQITESTKLITELSKYASILVKDFDLITSLKVNREIAINMHSLNVRDTINFCLDIFKALKLYKKKNIEIRQIIEDEVPDVLISDELRMKQIIINLLSNSFKFTNSGYILVHVSLSSDLVNRLSIKIIDTGNGIPTEKRKNLFKPYTGVSKENNEYGTGLGLNIVKELVDKLQGAIWSPLDKDKVGTTIITEIPFTITKQLKKVVINENKYMSFERNEHPVLESIIKSETKYNRNYTEKKEIEMDLETYTPKLGASKVKATTKNCPISFFDESDRDFVIFVDDDLNIRKLYQKMAEKYFSEKEKSLEIVICEDGIEALEYLYTTRSERKKCKAIITDDVMEFITGKELIRTLKILVEQSTIRELDIYAATSNQSIETLVGTQFLLVKPMTFKRFGDLIDKYN